MEYESTNRKAPNVSFREALIRGQAPDMGLYFPVEIPRFSEGELDSYRDMEYHEIAHSIALKYVGEDVPPKVVAGIARDAYDFDVPLEEAYDRVYVMRLDRGPTASFKDFAARMMARLMNHLMEAEGSELLILTATSGDTGSAVANAFHGLDSIRVVVLFPENEVTARQRKQMTTLGGNVTSIAVDGKFDDCQALVKKAFADPAMQNLHLSSANSINFGRLMPQSIYYVYAYTRLAEEGEKITFSVPSGNFGDLMGGLLAKYMGLPVDRFIVATNENDEFPRYMESGEYKPLKPSKACASNAMNVGHPSNLARLFHLYGGWMDEKGVVREHPDLERMRAELWSESVSDPETRESIKHAHQRYGVLLEPHGAVGWKALMDYLDSNDAAVSVSLETAEPAKFPEEIKKVLGVEPEMPDSLKGLDVLEEQVASLPSDYGALRDYLKSMD